MTFAVRGALGAALSLFVFPLHAATVTATASTIKAVFAAAHSGDTIKLTGSFAATALTNRSFAPPLVIDATAAVFTDTLSLYSLTNVTITGGHFGSASRLVGSAVRVVGGSGIKLLSPIVVGNRTTGHGIDFSGTSNVTVDNGSFTGLRAGVALSGVTGATLSRNRSLHASSDGFDIADSHQVVVSANSCSGTAISAGAHPDCVQLWSVLGHAVQSDIQVIDNIATGATQGFTSFDPDKGGGLRISILRNRVDTSYPQGIACYACVDSIIEGNIVTTQPGSQWQTRINIVGGSNNLVEGNSVADYVAPRAASLANLAVLAGDGIAGPAPASYAAALTGEVPEPATWALLTVGLGMAGAMQRRRRTLAA